MSAITLKINGFPISAPYGSIDRAHILPHKGIDFAVPLNTPIESIGNGVITQISDEGAHSFGKAVHMRLDDGTDVVYGHLSQFKTHVGDKVSRGDVIGMSGNTGDSTGPHVHIQTMVNGRSVDPTPYINGQGREWKWWEVVAHPVDYIKSVLADLEHALLDSVDKIAIILVFGGIFGIMAGIPKAGKFVSLVFGLWLIIRILDVVL
jgi:hypothetical protein